MRHKRKRKRIRKSDIILTIIAVTTIAFVVYNLRLFYLYQSVPDTLIVAYFGFISFEGGALAHIRSTETKYGDKDYYLDD